MILVVNLFCFVSEGHFKILCKYLQKICLFSLVQICFFYYSLQAALIMQVLSLTDQQIALLPEDQRQSIMVLKEQIAHSTQH